MPGPYLRNKEVRGVERCGFGKGSTLVSVLGITTVFSPACSLIGEVIAQSPGW